MKARIVVFALVSYAFVRAAPAECANLTWYTDEASFEAAAAAASCSTPTLDFEELAFRVTLEAQYAADGILFSGLAMPVIDDTVGASGVECGDTRCPRIPIDEDYGADDIPPYFRAIFDPPTTAVSFRLIGHGTGDDGDTEAATARIFAAGVETAVASAVPGGSTANGGIFVGLVSDEPFDTLELNAASVGDGIGFDDVWWKGRECLDLDGDGVTTAEGDCDDEYPATFPGAPELCDTLDNDCSGAPGDDEFDYDFDGYNDCVDTDLDGWTTWAGDCEPWESRVYPSAPDGTEVACDGLDNACDGLDVWDMDADYDGYPDCLDTDGDGVSKFNGDCDPWNGLVYPGALDTPGDGCNGLDDDCDGLEDFDADKDYDGYPDCLDLDGDGVSTFDGDCDPRDVTVFPGAPELCDVIDNNCDGVVPKTEDDADGDGFLACGGDCADGDSTRHPGAQELENGIDADCDGDSVGEILGCAAVTSGHTAGLVLGAIGALLLRRRRPVL